MAVKKGLGRGLDALMETVDREAKGEILRVSVYDIDINPDQPRKSFDADKLCELAASLKRHGLLQPLLVRRNGDRFTIVAGERRFRAAKLAELSELPVLLCDADEAMTAEIALIENLQREDLNPMERSRAFASLMREHGYSQEKLAKALGMSRPAVANSLRLSTLPEDAAKLVEQGKLSEGHAKVLLGVEDPKELLQLAQSCVEKQWSVRQLEEYVRLAALPKKTPQPKPRQSAQLRALTRGLTEHLSAKVEIRGDEDGGAILIRYADREGLAALYERIMGGPMD